MYKRQAANLDDGVDEFLGGSADEISYGKVSLRSLIFQDDILRMVAAAAAARAGNIKLHQMTQLKQLEMHPDKTVFMILGNKGNVIKIRQEIEANPIRLGDFETKEVQKEKWLGDIFHQDGLSKSVDETVRDRIGRTKAAVFETVSIVQDYRLASLGGLLSAFDIWEMCIIQSLLNNSEVWVEISPNTLDTLESLQSLFLRLTLDSPPSTPKVAGQWDAAMLGMKYRVMKRKLCFINSLKKSDDETLAKQIYTEQVENGWPGLAAEAKEICSVLNLPNITVSAVSQQDIDRSIKSANKDELVKEMEKSSKLKHLVEEDFERKEYLENNYYNYR